MRSHKKIDSDVFFEFFNRMMRKSLEWKKKVGSKAMKVWRQGFEPPRNGEKLRFSSGLKAEKRQLKRLQESKPSITTWLKKRRRNVNEQMEQNNFNDNAEGHDLEALKKKARTAAGAAWTSKHEKHNGKLQKLAHDRRFEAQRSNQLVSGEKLTSQEVQEMEGHQLKNDGAAKRKHERIAQAVTDSGFDFRLFVFLFGFFSYSQLTRANNDRKTARPWRSCWKDIMSTVLWTLRSPIQSGFKAVCTGVAANQSMSLRQPPALW